jgi:hypothetical protein
MVLKFLLGALVLFSKTAISCDCNHTPLLDLLVGITEVEPLSSAM